MFVYFEFYFSQDFYLKNLSTFGSAHYCLEFFFFFFLNEGHLPIPGLSVFVHVRQCYAVFFCLFSVVAAAVLKFKVKVIPF